MDQDPCLDMSLYLILIQDHILLNGAFESMASMLRIAQGLLRSSCIPMEA